VLRRLQPGSVRPGGTDLGAGLDAAIEALGSEEHTDGRAIVIFSDGEDHAERWRSRLDRLREAGVIVHAVAIGDLEEGHPVPSGEPGRPLTYEGAQVASRRVDSALEAIARQTDGAMLKLGLAPADLGALYRSRIAPVARRKRDGARIAERPEQFPVFLAAGLGFALAGCWPAGRLGPLRWLWSRVSGMILLAALGSAGLGARQADSVVELVSRGDRAYAEGRYAEALSSFEAAIPLAPRQPIPLYNAAAALFQLKRLDEARQRYLDARPMADPALRMKIDYALGNTALLLGDISEAVENYDLCLASTATGATLSEVRRDAAINRQFALEQARPSIGSEADDKRDRTKPRTRPPGAQRKSAGGDEPDTDDSSNDAQQDSPKEGGQGQDHTGKGHHRTGGAGGASQTATGPSGNSADEQLDSALAEIREASRSRLPDELPPDSAADPGKDW
jgi:Ca-activated chloride channel family protein